MLRMGVLATSHSVICIFLQTELAGCVGILWVFYVQILLSNLASKTRQLLNVSIFFPTPVFPKLRGKQQSQVMLVPCPAAL